MAKQAHNAPAIAPVPSQQRLKRLQVVQLKNLKDMDLSFGDEPLTAIMGANRSGKTTLLHSLACAHRPSEPNAVDYRFPFFFKPNTDSRWIGSDFTITYNHRVGQNVSELQQQYTKAQDRWTPRYAKRPIRPTRYMNIRDSVPEMEVLNRTSMIHYQKQNANDPIAISVNLLSARLGGILSGFSGVSSAAVGGVG
jgi:predicted ATP-binding protein involved in virulence